MMKKMLIAIVSLFLLYMILIPESWLVNLASILEIKPHHLDHKIMLLFTTSILTWVFILSVILTFPKIFRLESVKRFRFWKC
jgi:hypothetical protein